jgi:hypothetical protein
MFAGEITISLGEITISRCVFRLTAPRGGSFAVRRPCCNCRSSALIEASSSATQADLGRSGRRRWMGFSPKNWVLTIEKLDLIHQKWILTIFNQGFFVKLVLINHPILINQHPQSQKWVGPLLLISTSVSPQLSNTLLTILILFDSSDALEWNWL